MIDKDIDWSLKTWRERHDQGYFPNSEIHKDWKIYDSPPSWLIEFGKPTESDIVLEIGCGYGEWMIPLAPMVKTVWGIDIHESPITMATRKFAEHKVEDNCYASVSDGTTIPFFDNTFTLIYSISVFQHIPKKMAQEYLREAFRVTRQGGRGLFHLRNMDNVGPHPTPASDITENHDGDFSCGWTASEAMTAGINAGWNCRVENLGLFLVIVGVKS